MFFARYGLLNKTKKELNHAFSSQNRITRLSLVLVLIVVFSSAHTRDGFGHAEPVLLGLFRVRRTVQIRNGLRHVGRRHASRRLRSRVFRRRVCGGRRRFRLHDGHVRDHPGVVLRRGPEQVAAVLGRQKRVRVVRRRRAPNRAARRRDGPSADRGRRQQRQRQQLQQQLRRRRRRRDVTGRRQEARGRRHGQGDEETAAGRQRPRTPAHGKPEPGVQPTPHRAAHSAQRPAAVQVRDATDGPVVHHRPGRFTALTTPAE